MMAQRCANSMAARHSMDHAGFFTERVPAGARAENVAWGCATESCTISIWEGSAGHRANMLLSHVRGYGIGQWRWTPLLVLGPWPIAPHCELPALVHQQPLIKTPDQISERTPCGGFSFLWGSHINLRCRN
jgi:hypothetical protein